MACIATNIFIFTDYAVIITIIIIIHGCIVRSESNIALYNQETSEPKKSIFFWQRSHSHTLGFDSNGLLLSDNNSSSASKPFKRVRKRKEIECISYPVKSVLILIFSTATEDFGLGNKNFLNSALKERFMNP